MKKILFFAVVIAIAVLSIFFLAQRERPTNETNKITVVTTLIPLYDFAKNIGGERANVSLLLPPGIESHAFAPKPSDIAKISKSDIFIYTGKFMEPWAEDVLGGVTNQNLLVVDGSLGVTLIPVAFHADNEPAGSPDPHFWLDFGNAKIMVENIAQAFLKKDPANAAYYEERANQYKIALTNLDNEFRTNLTKCKNKEIVYGGHYAFGYLARAYDLNYLAAQGLAPDAEPTAQDLAKLVDQIRNQNIKYVFYEELTSPKIAETLAGETGAKMLFLSAAHNISKKDFQNNVTFLKIMEDDLKNLKIGLECEK